MPYSAPRRFRTIDTVVLESPSRRATSVTVTRLFPVADVDRFAGTRYLKRFRQDVEKKARQDGCIKTIGYHRLLPVSSGVVKTGLWRLPPNRLGFPWPLAGRTTASTDLN